jgi:hypothetical protein
MLSAVQDLIQIPEVDGSVFPHRFAPMQWRVRIISIDERWYRRASPANLLRQCPQPLIFRPHEKARQSRAGEQERSSVSLPAMLTVRNIADHDHAPGPQLDRHLAPFQKIGNSCAQ